MPEKYGTHETATLIVLMLAKGEVPNPDLKNEHGIELRPASREKLNKAGLIESRTDTRPFVHRITDAGVEWCEQELTGVKPPERSGPLVRQAFTVVRHLVQYLRRSNIRLIDVIHPDDLESLIREAYQELSVKQEEWVRLAKLRPKLNGAGKEEVDRVLRAMTKTGLVHLAPSANPRGLTDDDHAAAIRIGSEDNHLVAIEES
jgi:DNA-binding PadR family transcriptional regulator